MSSAIPPAGSPQPSQPAPENICANHIAPVFPKPATADSFTSVQPAQVDSTGFAYIAPACLKGDNYDLTNDPLITNGGRMFADKLFARDLAQERINYANMQSVPLNGRRGFTSARNAAGIDPQTLDEKNLDQAVQNMVAGLWKNDDYVGGRKAQIFRMEEIVGVHDYMNSIQDEALKTQFKTAFQKEMASYIYNTFGNQADAVVDSLLALIQSTNWQSVAPGAPGLSDFTRNLGIGIAGNSSYNKDEWNNKALYYYNNDHFQEPFGKLALIRDNKGNLQYVELEGGKQFINYTFPEGVPGTGTPAKPKGENKGPGIGGAPDKKAEPPKPGEVEKQTKQKIKLTRAQIQALIRQLLSRGRPPSVGELKAFAGEQLGQLVEGIYFVDAALEQAIKPENKKDGFWYKLDIGDRGVAYYNLANYARNLANALKETQIGDSRIQRLDEIGNRWSKRFDRAKEKTKKKIDIVKDPRQKTRAVESAKINLIELVTKILESQEMLTEIQPPATAPPPATHRNLDKYI